MRLINIPSLTEDGAFSHFDFAKKKTPELLNVSRSKLSPYWLSMIPPRITTGREDP
jgi:hypothetical protein